MKRLTAILFLLVLAFNFYGYRLLLSAMQEESVVLLEKKADANDYTESELISIKTVLHLPYYTSSAEYERAYGSVTIEGKDYEYVKRRVFNDTLELLCLPNPTKTKLKEAGNEVTKSLSAGQASLPSKKVPGNLKITLPDFFVPVGSGTEIFAVGIKPSYTFIVNVRCMPGYLSGTDRPPQSMLHLL